MYEDIGPLIFYNTSYPIKAFTTTRNFFKEKLKVNKAEVLKEFPEPKRSLFLSLIKHIKLPNFSKILLCEQVHSNKVVFVDKFFSFNDLFINGNRYFYRFFYNTDGILTNLENSIIFIFTADCIPFFVYESKNCVIGLLHVGRRGLEAGIIENFLNIIASKTTNISNFNFIVGPHICKNCYIVEGSSYDLSYKLRSKLFKAKIEPSQIYFSPYCTSCQNDKFFSFRREHTSFRLISAIYNFSI